jgi:hypothetical protein
MRVSTAGSSGGSAGGGTVNCGRRMACSCDYAMTIAPVPAAALIGGKSRRAAAPHQRSRACLGMAPVDEATKRR